MKQMMFALAAAAIVPALPCAACKTPLPGADGKHPAVTYAPFPDALSAFVWRNWPVVDAERLAETIGAAKADVEETVRAIESTAARLQADDGVKLDMPDDTTSYRPKQRKLDNTQPFTF